MTKKVSISTVSHDSWFKLTPEDRSERIRIANEPNSDSDDDEVPDVQRSINAANGRWQIDKVEAYEGPYGTDHLYAIISEDGICKTYMDSNDYVILEV